MNSNAAPAPVLSYHQHQTNALPNPLLATFLFLPGGICWFCYGLLAARSHLLDQMPIFIPLGLLSWPVAVITAIASLILYAPPSKPKAWYTWFNLAFNVSGLLFTLAALIGGRIPFLNQL